MTTPRRFQITSLILTALLAASSPARAGEGPSQPEIDAAIARGLAFLRDQQSPAGEWSYPFNQSHTLGITALAGLALLENNVDPSDPAIAKANETIKFLAKRSDQTYDLSLAILFLARVQKGPTGSNDPLIIRLAKRLANGGENGFWTYTVPLESDQESRDNRRSSRPPPPRPTGEGDNSNTQFALLGLWAAGRHGFDPNASLEAVDHHFRSTPDSNGRWGYVPGEPGRDAMTCAGLMGLAIAAARPDLAERQTARARGAALAADPLFTAALASVSKDARQINRHSDIYYLWSLERVSVALGLRALDGFDWYAAGAIELLRRQNPGGSWPHEHWGVLPNTCLSLLFLRKANLAFELDRVLKLPDSSKPDPTEVPPEPPPASPPGPDAEASVLVTSASDAAFPEITVDFEVKRPDGTYILDAAMDDFRVVENGLPAPVLRLQAPSAREARPITVVLVVDRSRSMEEENRLGSLKRAVATFLDGLPQGSRVALIAFGSEVNLTSPFTQDFSQVRQAVDALSPAGATRYYDAVQSALNLLSREPGRRAVLALTDGEDTFSQDATLDTVIASAQGLGLPIHTLGLGSEDEIESDALKRLALSTRGQYYPATSADQLRSIYELLAERLRSSYTLAYQTTRKVPDGTLRPVQIFYRASRRAGETTVFIPGMVVPAAGWSPLFLMLVLVLFLLAFLPGRLRAKPSQD